MVILDCDAIEPWLAHLPTVNVRVANDLDYPGEYRGLQLHPRDTGGALLEINCSHHGAWDGPYHPAGPRWKGVHETDEERIVAAELQSAGPGRASPHDGREILRRPCATPRRADDRPRPGRACALSRQYRRPRRGTGRYRHQDPRPRTRPMRRSAEGDCRRGWRADAMRDAGPAGLAGPASSFRAGSRNFLDVHLETPSTNTSDRAGLTVDVHRRRPPNGIVFSKPMGDVF